MSAFLIVRVNITDWDAYKEYMKLTPAIVEAHGGKFVARGGDVLTLEGPKETNRVVLVEFPSVDAARRFYESDGYQSAIAIRRNAAEAQFIVVEGV